MKDKELRQALIKANVFYSDSLISTHKLDHMLSKELGQQFRDIRKEIDEIRQENKALRELLNVEYVDTCFTGLQKGDKKVAFK